MRHQSVTLRTSHFARARARARARRVLCTLASATKCLVIQEYYLVSSSTYKQLSSFSLYQCGTTHLSHLTQVQVSQDFLSTNVGQLI